MVSLKIVVALLVVVVAAEAARLKKGGKVQAGRKTRSIKRQAGELLGRYVPPPQNVFQDWLRVPGA